MSKFEVVFSTTTQAFEDNYEYELDFVLTQVQYAAVSLGRDFSRLHDSNGSRVGFFNHQKGDE
jgi:hypothetical protein